MWKWRKIQGLMAAALYGDLDERERKALDRHLAASPESRRELESLNDLVQGLPHDQPELDRDLLPAIRARLSAEPEPVAASSWHVAMAAALGLMLFAGVVYRIWVGSLTATTSRVAEAPAEVGAASPAMGMIREASGRMDRRDYGSAYAILRTAVASYPGDACAGEAQQQLAALSFEHLARYKDAFDAYLTLRTKYPAVFESDPKNADRLDLLDEARKVNYASLELLDVARNKRGDAIVALEDVVARYPSTQVASLAVDEMVKRMARDVPVQDAPSRLKAIEQARNQCTNPTAVARLDIEAGLVYWKDLHDTAKARQFGHRALDSGDPAAVELARNFLEDIDSTGAR